MPQRKRGEGVRSRITRSLEGVKRREERGRTPVDPDAEAAREWREWMQSQPRAPRPEILMPAWDLIVAKALERFPGDPGPAADIPLDRVPRLREQGNTVTPPEAQEPPVPPVLRPTPIYNPLVE